MKNNVGLYLSAFTFGGQIAQSRIRVAVITGVVVVCQTERFEASCERRDEVIVMTSSNYGRMRVSRCVQSDYGYIGCSADVIGLVDSACSGRRRCSLGVPSGPLEQAAAVACPGDLKSYLAASYRCLKGNTAVLSTTGIRVYYGSGTVALTSS